MSDFFEIDFLDVESKKSGDAIAIRYSQNGQISIHVVDGGYQSTGDTLVKHINQYYGSPTKIDQVVLTHPDGDHAGGLRTVLEEFQIGRLWMLRPWLYASELLPRFQRFTTVEGLSARLKDVFPHISALEEIAIRNRIPIFEPFQGAKIGAFTVMTPTKERYLQLVVDSEKTPNQASIANAQNFSSLFERALANSLSFVRSLWGEEKFSNEPTSRENEMSVVQFAEICGMKILLTGDTGREGLEEAASFAPFVGLQLPGIDRFQVPHHGSRRNVSTDILNKWLGNKLPIIPSPGAETFSAIISSAKADPDHPRKSVIRAMIHRGGRVYTTEGRTINFQSNAPSRSGWSSVQQESYPQEQED